MITSCSRAVTSTNAGSEAIVSRTSESSVGLFVVSRDITTPDLKRWALEIGVW